MESLEQKEYVGKDNVMSDLESCLNFGLIKLEQTAFMLNDLANLFADDDRTIERDNLKPGEIMNKFALLLLETNRANMLSNIANEIAHDALSEIQEACEACETLMKLNKKGA